MNPVRFKVTLRNWESFDLSQINRDPDNLQENLSETEYAIEIPGINHRRRRNQVEDGLNLRANVRNQLSTFIFTDALSYGCHDLADRPPATRSYTILCSGDGRKTSSRKAPSMA